MWFLKLNIIMQWILYPTIPIWYYLHEFYFSYESLCSGEKATAECVADAIVDNRVELVHLPSAINLDAPLPSKECPTCDGTVNLLVPRNLYFPLYQTHNQYLYPKHAGYHLAKLKIWSHKLDTKYLLYFRVWWAVLSARTNYKSESLQMM